MGLRKEGVDEGGPHFDLDFSKDEASDDGLLEEESELEADDQEQEQEELGLGVEDEGAGDGAGANAAVVFLG